MAMLQNPKAGPTTIDAGFGAQTSIERSLALALSPFRQGLRFYADFQRSALDTFARATATVFPVMANAPRSPEPAAKPTVPLKRAETTKPATTKRPTATKPAAAKPTTTKRPTATKPAAAKPTTTKRPTATKPATAKAARSAPGRAAGRSASKKPAAVKAAPKRALKSAARAKPAVAKATKKVASKSSRPRGARAGAARKA